LPSLIDTALRQLGRRSLLTHWLPLLVWMGLIYWFSDQPQPFTMPQSWQQEAVGVIGHVIGYATLALLWCRALARQHTQQRYTLALAFFLTMLYALSDEYHQTFVPGRSGNLPDLIIDAAGAGLGLRLAHSWVRRFVPPKRS